MPDKPTLRDKARDAVRCGSLPTRFPSRVFGGPGSGNACAVCGQQIRRQEMELELEFTMQDAPARTDRYRLYPACCNAWESERTKIVGPSLLSRRHALPASRLDIRR
jgi:hypothetical protein